MTTSMMMYESGFYVLSRLLVFLAGEKNTSSLTSLPEGRLHSIKLSSVSLSF